jgi:hypothetical protein
MIKNCSNCLHFVIYEGCVLLMKCKKYNRWTIKEPNVKEMHKEKTRLEREGEV